MPTVDVNGVELYYESRGEGPPVIFLHGAGADHRYWAEVTDLLTDDYEVITLDMRLHGRTGGDPDPAPTTATYVQDLHAFIDSLDLDRPAIVGHSMGGMIAQRYVDTYPDDVRALVTLGATTTDPRSASEWFTWKVVYPVHDWLTDNVGQSAAHKLMKGFLWLRGDDIELSGMERRERIEATHNDDYPEPTDAQDSAIREALADWTDPSIDYAAIPVPYLYLYGEKELDSFPAHAEYVAETAPHGRAVEIPDASHHSHVDTPEFVVDAIREFLDEEVGAGTAITGGE